MEKNKWNGADFINRLGEESWTYIKTVVDIVREPVHTKTFEQTMAGRTEKLEIHIKKLEDEIRLLVDRIKI